MSALAEFLLARIYEDEAWALGAIETPGATHWHWMNSDTDEPVIVEPLLDEFIDYPSNGDSLRADLRTVEELKPVSWAGGRPLPDFVLQNAEEIRAAVAGHLARWDPARVLAECEAKRRIVKFAEYWLGATEGMEAEFVLGSLALPYADHPDYDEAWTFG
jgi:hypothetical protein